MKHFWAALQFLTPCPWPTRSERSSGEIGQSAAFFPVIGLVLGLLLVAINWLLNSFVTSGVLSVLLVTALILATRGFHLDGLADTFDGIGAGGDRERVLAIMDDSHIGVFGVAAIILVIVAKVEAIDALGDSRWRALLLAPLLGRWAMVFLAYHSTPAKEGLGSLMIVNMDSSRFFGATFFTLVLAVTIQRTIGIALFVGAAIFAFAWKTYFHNRLGGLTGDTFGAVGELTETSVLILLAVGKQ